MPELPIITSENFHPSIATQQELDAHVADLANPHQVTAAQLDAVTNTELSNLIGAPSGICPLDGTGIIDVSYLPSSLDGDHNNLSSLQGGTTGQYYHLTSPQHTELLNTLSVISTSGSDLVVDDSLDVVNNITVGNNVTITGNLYVNGQEHIIDTEAILVKDNTLTLNNGEVGNGVTHGISGIVVDRGLETNYGFIFDETSDTFRVGLFEDNDPSSTITYNDTHAVATREDNPIANSLVNWNDTEKRFDSIDVISNSTGYTFNTGAADKDFIINKQSGEAYKFDSTLDRHIFTADNDVGFAVYRDSGLNNRYTAIGLYNNSNQATFIRKGGSSATYGMGIFPSDDSPVSSVETSTTILDSRIGAAYIGHDSYVIARFGYDGSYANSEFRTYSSKNTFEGSVTVTNLLNMVNKLSEPTTLGEGDLWVEVDDVDNKLLKYYDGTDTYSVQLSKE